MKILIVYGTSEGQTRKIARFMEEVLQGGDHKVVIADATEEPPSPSHFEVVLIGASVHMQKYQSAVTNYVMRHLDILNKKHSAFFSVSMAIASNIEEEHEEIKKIALDFFARTGWKPNEVRHFAGALKYTQYDYFKKLIMRMIAKKEGGSTDTSRDHEYTDWDNVKSFVLNFCAENVQSTV
ncbi:NAD(P)H dehydrogenase (quinone) [Allomuricauda ruestringensis DSM 13258]|uniref:NAD(P)H dehydrogenase (Quinone) n=1 Tax=Allomuricauda ruestringensis (strain DSM 13258 / CIP 107369 / LMG 19739 / B1) TaxID=886377 RepID=G2PRR3_ALLRU|nr:flavodoxin domain-containing protein [Allomuricauda ruestringensis]AEM69512.1 NAD(P)H dehydrogenase (quinone) [Allomuricauda ruestringensis DSM 13258]